MKTTKLLFFSLLLSLSFFSCQNDDTDTDIIVVNPSEYYENLDVSYGDDSDQRFDIYLPANRTADTKIIILVHGGGWSSGDKSDMIGFKDFVRDQFPDVGIVNMNYRLADTNNHPYPMQLNDITSVINHLKDNQSNYVIDNAFGFVGVSAGGHLSLLWSYAFDFEDSIHMVCSIVGPTNFTDPAYLNNSDPDLQELLDLYAANATTEFLEEVSPYHRTTATAPATILFYGGQDPLIPVTQGTDMRDKLEDLGVAHSFTLYPNAGHGWVGLDLIDTGIKLKAFMQMHL